MSQYKDTIEEFAHLTDEGLAYVASGVIHRREYPERVQRMEIELDRRRRAKMQHIELWPAGEDYHPAKCKCDIKQLFGIGHDADCVERKR